MLSKFGRMVEELLPVEVSPFKPNEVIDMALDWAFKSGWFDDVSDAAKSNANWHRREIKASKITSKQMAGKTPEDLNIMVIHQAVAVLQLLAYSPRAEKGDYAYTDSMTKARGKIRSILIKGHLVAEDGHGWIDYKKLPILSNGEHYIKPTELAFCDYVQPHLLNEYKGYQRSIRIAPGLRAARKLKEYNQTKMLRKSLSVASFSEAQTLILPAKEMAESKEVREQDLAKYKERIQQKSKLFQRELASLPEAVCGMWKQKKELKKSFSEDNLLMRVAKSIKRS